MTEISDKFTIFTPVYLNPGMHFDLEVKGLTNRFRHAILADCVNVEWSHLQKYLELTIDF